MSTDASSGRSLRLLQVLVCDDLGGTELMVAALSERLNGPRIGTTVALLAPRGPIAARLSAAGIDVRSLGNHGQIASVVALGCLIRRERFDLVAAYGWRSTSVLRLLLPLLSPGTRFVCGVRGLLVTGLENPNGRRARLITLFERMTSRFVDAYDVNSRGAYSLLKEAGIAERRLWHIPNGIDPCPWQGAGLDERPTDTPTIICVARFHPLKRHADLVQAAALLDRECAQFRMVFVGTGPTMPAIRELVHAEGLAGRVFFLGEVQPAALPEVLGRTQIFCLPSVWEGMPGSVMEAMASGLPVVGTRVNGIADLVLDGTSGFLVPPFDPKSLAEALRRLLDSTALRREMGTAGRERITSHYTLDRMVRCKEDLYYAVMERP